MTERIPKTLLFVAIVLGALLLSWFAYCRPGYFVSQRNLGALLFLELTIAAVWFYRKSFFAVVMIIFLLAGSNFPGGATWDIGRWAVLGVGALVGSILVLKEHQLQFGMFHVVAGFSVLASLASAAVSRYSVVSNLKVLSLALLFVYAATGVRLAVIGRERQFFSGLLTGCEVFVGIFALFYVFGRSIMGNPNSTGAVMGVLAPILLWGTLLKQEQSARNRRLLFYALAMYLVFASHARAGMLASFLSCALLCVGLRRYVLLMKGIGIVVILLTAMAIVQPDAFSRMISTATSDVVFKGKDPEQGILSSRLSPWQQATDSIKQHFWFGTGFGTSDRGEDVKVEGFSTVSGEASTEHGSSYLAIAAWVGVVGILPFVLLLGSLLAMVTQTVRWMLRSGDPAHGAVPLAMVIVAGLAHAGFEDWLFAPGYHLCVFFWSMAFVLADQVLALNAASARRYVWGSFRTTGSPFNPVAPLR